MGGPESRTLDDEGLPRPSSSWCGPSWPGSKEAASSCSRSWSSGSSRRPGTSSATRDILTVGAELSLVGEQTLLVRTMTELGVNAGVVVALSIALVLVRRFARLDRA